MPQTVTPLIIDILQGIHDLGISAVHYATKSNSVLRIFMILVYFSYRLKNYIECMSVHPLPIVHCP